MALYDAPDLKKPFIKKGEGKVRELYTYNNKFIMITTDRISAFDHILSKAIPYKGQVLNQLAAYYLDRSRDIISNWLLAQPHPNVSVGVIADPIPVEIVVRGYLAGHAWRLYRSGQREICGVKLPDSMRESSKLPFPIITPATKAVSGHDEDISAEEILKREILTEVEWEYISSIALKLFKRGTEIARSKGLILVDTKYEFGRKDDEIILIDEVHTPDSSRYYLLDGYGVRLKKDEPQKQLSKEFVREWLMKNNFQGLSGEHIPELPDNVVSEISTRYVRLYEMLTGKKFNPAPQDSTHDDIITSIKSHFSL